LTDANFKLLTRLIEWLATHEKQHTKYQMAMINKLTRVRELPEGVEWEYEVKWDGYRIEAVKDGTSVRLLSRRGSDYSQRFRSVAKAVADIAAESAVLDGEVVAVDAKGQPSFQVLQNRGRLPEGYRGCKLIRVNGQPTGQ